ncbi:MAG: hypothetical protein NPIRA02_28640 [Nitrospirales bacterium]|nr:MAG: hypothetical protein NPIRA02_28640 [Nitrospirales bacterium]
MVQTSELTVRLFFFATVSILPKSYAGTDKHSVGQRYVLIKTIGGYVYESSQGSEIFFKQDIA